MASQKCCVDGCTNKKGGAASLFRVLSPEESETSFMSVLEPFLKEEFRETTLRGHTNLQICEKHFAEEHIVPKYKNPNKKGKWFLRNGENSLWLKRSPRFPTIHSSVSSAQLLFLSKATEGV
ncbi:hypothetical protein DMENIID0001_063230 [Sergentomyia squamirostris]